MKLRKIFRIIFVFGVFPIILSGTSCARWDKDFFRCEVESDCPKGQVCSPKNWCVVPTDIIVGDIVNDAQDNGMDTGQ